MAEDLSTTAIDPCGFVAVRLAMDGTAGNALQVTLPSWARRIDLTWVQSDASADTGKISHTGTDGAAIGTEAFPVGSGNTYTILRVGNRETRGGDIYLAGGTNSGFCHMLLQLA